MSTGMRLRHEALIDPSMVENDLSEQAACGENVQNKALSKAWSEGISDRTRKLASCLSGVNTH